MTGAFGSMSRPAVVSIGVSVIMVSVIVLPALPLVVPAVCVWWLADDLTRNPDRRPAVLGWVALIGFAVVAVVGVTGVTIVDTHFDCGGTLGGFGESADARLDQSCADGRRWRSVVGVTLTLALCAAGIISVRRSEPSTPPLAVAARTIAIMLISIIVLTGILVIT